MTSALTAAAGPGTVVTSWPASSTARTSRSPGSLIPGVPASVTTATSPPSPSTWSTSGMRAASVCSLHTANRVPAIPACWSNRPVRRVSSQHTRAAAASASRARGDRSPRLPIGVATRTRRPGRRSATDFGGGRGTLAQLDDVADRQVPALERAGLRLDDPGCLGHRPPKAVAPHADGLDDDAVAVDERHVEGEAHPDRVHPAARLQHQRALEVISLQQPAPTRLGIRRHLRGREHSCLAHQPAHRGSMARRSGRGPLLGPPSTRVAAGPVATVPATRAATRPRRAQEVRVPGSILGNRVVRKEDPKFLTSGGKYLDDLNDMPELADAAHVVYVRATVAHGLISSIDTSEAAGMPGVVGVFTAADLGLEPSPSPFNPTVARTLLASDRVRYVGEPIVAVVAETREQATDAAETVILDYDVLEPVVDVEAAVESSTILYDGAGSNVVFDSTALGAP